MNDPEFIQRIMSEQAGEPTDRVLPPGVSPLLTPKDAAMFLSCSRSHLDRLVTGGLPLYNFTPPGSDRRVIRFDIEELRARGREVIEFRGNS